MNSSTGHRGPPRQERAQRSRRDILTAARMAFAQFGFEGTNIRDIAKQVGVTHTLIRYHFGNKLELWKAVVDDMFAGLSGAFSNDRTGSSIFGRGRACDHGCVTISVTALTIPSMSGS